MKRIRNGRNSYCGPKSARKWRRLLVRASRRANR